jgi:hypothetical protein
LVAGLLGVRLWLVDADPKPRFFVVNPAGDVTASFVTFEEARMRADEDARAAKMGGREGVCWEVVRHPQRRRLRRVLHRAFPVSPPGGGGPSGPGTSDVREPRRPRPGSSSGAVELELPP